MGLTPERYLDLISSEGAALADACGRSPHGRPPGCPEWDVAGLGRHTGVIHRWVTAMVAGRSTERLGRRDIVTPDADDEVPGWLRDGVSSLVGVLREAGTSAPVWSWTPEGPPTSAFWYRRMAQETAVHRWDAESAGAEGPGPIEPELAADGIDELFTVMLPLKASGGGVDLGGSLHVHCTDTEGEWVLEPGGGPVPVVTRTHAKSDTALRGPASDLLITLWGRPRPGSVELLGSPHALERWLDQARF